MIPVGRIGNCARGLTIVHLAIPRAPFLILSTIPPAMVFLAAPNTAIQITAMVQTDISISCSDPSPATGIPAVGVPDSLARNLALPKASSIKIPIVMATPMVIGAMAFWIILLVASPRKLTFSRITGTAMASKRIGEKATAIQRITRRPRSTMKSATKDNM